jgi:hypothetical protein
MPPPPVPDSSRDDPILLSEFHQTNRVAYLASLEELGEKWLQRLDATAEPHDWDVLTAWDGRIRDAAGASSRAWKERHELLTVAPLWLRSRAGIVAWQMRYINERLAFLTELRHHLHE